MDVCFGESRLILIRHGETVGNSSVRYYGRSDLELSALGRAQMHAAARWLAARFDTTRIAPVFSSTMRRAAEGARIIAGAAAMLTEIAEFVEVDFGLFEGLTADEIRERYPADFERWKRERFAPAYSYPGGESRAEFTARVAVGAARMLAQLDLAAGASLATNAGALLVAHRGVIRTLTQRLAGVEASVELASINILRRAHHGADWRAEALDVTEHLTDVAQYDD